MTQFDSAALLGEYEAAYAAWKRRDQSLVITGPNRPSFIRNRESLMGHAFWAGWDGDGSLMYDFTTPASQKTVRYANWCAGRDCHIKLVKQFEADVDLQLDEIRRQRWSPASTRYIPMFERPDEVTGQRPDPVKVCKRLLVIAPPDGMYTFLRKVNRMDLCSEALVVKYGPPLFSDDDVKVAQNKMATLS
jgi:hypothetical protein